MDVTIHSFRTRLASVYAPVHDSLKASLIESLRDSKVITPTTKSEGDWNCVARPIVDLSRVSGVAGDDAHGASLESVLCSSGLIDAFRLRYGDSAKEWTHLTPSVYKRLDRFYTPAHNSHFTWVQSRLTCLQVSSRASWKSIRGPNSPPNPSQPHTDQFSYSIGSH